MAGLGSACTTGSTDDGSNGHGPGAAEPVPFRADRQLGVLRPPMAAGAVAAFDASVGTSAELIDTLQTLTSEIERLMSAQPATEVGEIRPPLDSGAVGVGAPPVGTSVVLGVGSSLFDDRFGIADRQPTELISMPTFRNDFLVRPERSNGDLVLLIAASSTQAVAHALHQIVRVTQPSLKLRWVQEGYNDLSSPSEGGAPTRNLMGFKDGTSNLDTTDDVVMDEHVWVQPGDAEPAWASGGTYLAVRVIRMLIEFWSTAALVRQEQIIGRHRDTGAPLGQSEEGEEPAFASDTENQAIAPTSHLRRANPRQANTGRLLRRGFSYLDGADDSGTLDQGLLFLAYQRSLNAGFLSAQSRLDGEPLEDYVQPVGGGLFYVVPGPGSGDGGWLGQGLFEG